MIPIHAERLSPDAGLRELDAELESPAPDADVLVAAGAPTLLRGEDVVLAVLASVAGSRQYRAAIN
jgi:hypothetical protein